MLVLLPVLSLFAGMRFVVLRLEDVRRMLVLIHDHPDLTPWVTEQGVAYLSDTDLHVPGVPHHRLGDLPRHPRLSRLRPSEYGLIRSDYARRDRIAAGRPLLGDLPRMYF